MVTDIATDQTPQDVVAAHVIARLSCDDILRYLPEPHRTTVGLVYAHGLSVAPTASFLEAPAGTVKSRCHHGLHKLRTRLVSHGADPTGVVSAA